MLPVEGYEQDMADIAYYNISFFIFRSCSGATKKPFQNIILERFLYCNLAVPTGFEPAIFCVTGRHVGPLHHGTEFSNYAK